MTAAMRDSAATEISQRVRFFLDAVRDETEVKISSSARSKQPRARSKVSLGCERIDPLRKMAKSRGSEAESMQNVDECRIGQ